MVKVTKVRSQYVASDCEISLPFSKCSIQIVFRYIDELNRYIYFSQFPVHEQIKRKNLCFNDTTNGNFTDNFSYFNSMKLWLKIRRRESFGRICLAGKWLKLKSQFFKSASNISSLRVCLCIRLIFLKYSYDGVQNMWTRVLAEKMRKYLKRMYHKIANRKICENEFSLGVSQSQERSWKDSSEMYVVQLSDSNTSNQFKFTTEWFYVSCYTTSLAKVDLNWFLKKHKRIWLWLNKFKFPRTL